MNIHTGKFWDCIKVTVFVLLVSLFGSAVWADEAGMRVERLGNRGDRVDRRLDNRGSRIDRRLGQRARRVDRHRPR